MSRERMTRITALAEIICVCIDTVMMLRMITLINHKEARNNPIHIMTPHKRIVSQRKYIPRTNLHIVNTTNKSLDMTGMIGR
jgi:hypothetical protein